MTALQAACVAREFYVGDGGGAEVQGDYQGDGVAGGEGEDVGAGDGGATGGLHPGLDVVDDFVPAEGVGVGHRVLLADHARCVVEEDGRITALRKKSVWSNLSLVIN